MGNVSGGAAELRREMNIVFLEWYDAFGDKSWMDRKRL